MKYTGIFRIFSIVLILSLLIVAIPASPALAAGQIDLDPNKGKIGEYFYVEGEDFPESENVGEVDEDISEVDIYFSSEEADVSDYIDNQVENYELLKSGKEVDDDGEFRQRVEVPDELTDGEDDEVVSGGQYYVYVTYANSDRIRAVAEFTVIGSGGITIDPDEGPVGTRVKISGEDFDSEENITIEYDGEEIEIQGGDDETDDDGEFEDTIIIIPDSTAGDHTITVIGDESNTEAEDTFTVESEITVSPTSGPPNTIVLVIGTGFGRKVQTSLYFEDYELSKPKTDIYGSFEISFILPTVPPAIYDISAEDEDNNEATVRFTTTVTTPSADISQTTGNVGTGVTVSGVNFEAGGNVTITYDGTEVATATADSNGAFSATFNTPASIHGNHTVTITDGTTSREFTFTVESEAPPVPLLLLPKTGAQVEQPVYLYWGDVNDPSLPITYHLQIASDENFSPTSVVLEKEGLTKPEYTITEEEKLEPFNTENPHYWRIKATDGAANESEWSSAGSFYISPVSPTAGIGFTMPQWAIYALYGLGALLLGIIGFWLGRKSAYY